MQTRIASVEKSRVVGAVRAIALRVAAIAGLFGILGAVYVFAIRPGQLHWGATAAEIAASMPEDGIVSHPAFDATRAITIHARPEEIWPWLAQMGYGRAGFYGYDLIENPGGGAGIRSATRILPAYQNPLTGEPLPLSVAATLEFGTIETNRCLVWRAGDEPPSGVFIWQLAPIDDSHTRLISRIRWRYLDTWQGGALGLFSEVADHVAVRAILNGVRDRAEHRAPVGLVTQGVQIGAWIVAFGELCTAAALVLFMRRWGTAWFLALGAGLLLDLELYALPAAAISAAFSLLYLGAMTWRLRQARAQCRASLRSEPLGL